MNGEFVLDSLEFIDADLIEEATSHSMVLVFMLAIVILLFCPAAGIPNLAFVGSIC